MATNNSYIRHAVGKNIPLVHQVSCLKIKYPQFSVTSTSYSMIINGSIRPTSRSVLYDFIIEYELNKMPITRIAEGQLIRNVKGEEIPHMYNQDSLCLFRPKYRQFIPWTSLWLYHYESWHVTGKWLGGGEHSGSRNQW